MRRSRLGGTSHPGEPQPMLVAWAGLRSESVSNREALDSAVVCRGRPDGHDEAVADRAQSDVSDSRLARMESVAPGAIDEHDPFNVAVTVEQDLGDASAVLDDVVVAIADSVLGSLR